jgi:hypothetical protein
VSPVLNPLFKDALPMLLPNFLNNYPKDDLKEIYDSIVTDSVKNRINNLENETRKAKDEASKAKDEASQAKGEAREKEKIIAELQKIINVNNL